MISNPKNGWCDFDLGEFHGTPSYITDVPMDLLNACYQYIIGNSEFITIRFDEEGNSFILVADYYDCYIIEQKDEAKFYWTNINIKSMIKEIIDDIEKDIDNWAKFGSDDDPKEIKYNKTRMLELIEKIKERIDMYKYCC